MFCAPSTKFPVGSTHIYAAYMLPNNFNLFCVHLIHRGYDPSDMELVNTEK